MRKNLWILAACTALGATPSFAANPPASAQSYCVDSYLATKHSQTVDLEQVLTNRCTAGDLITVDVMAAALYCDLSKQTIAVGPFVLCTLQLPARPMRPITVTGR